MDRRVALHTLLAIGIASASTSCWGSGPEDDNLPRFPDGCAFSRNFITVKRPGPAEDLNLWELTLYSPTREIVCWSARGGWLCNDPAFDGRRVSDLGFNVAGVDQIRGLPVESHIRGYAPFDEDNAAWTFDIRKNGRLVVDRQQPACDQYACPGGELGHAVVTIPSTEDP